jgi:hypothetical protein
METSGSEKSSRNLLLWGLSGNLIEKQAVCEKTPVGTMHINGYEKRENQERKKSGS